MLFINFIIYYFILYGLNKFYFITNNFQKQNKNRKIINYNIFGFISLIFYIFLNIFKILYYKIMKFIYICKLNFIN